MPILTDLKCNTAGNLAQYLFIAASTLLSLSYFHLILYFILITITYF